MKLKLTAQSFARNIMTPSLQNPTRLKAWAITQLAAEIAADLGQCTTQSERTNCLAVYTREIRELRDEKMRKGEPFTPGETSVLLQYGIETPVQIREHLRLVLPPIDQVKDGLAGLIETAFKVDDNEWARAITRAGTNRPCDSGRAAEQNVARIGQAVKNAHSDMIRFCAIMNDASSPAQMRLDSVTNQMQETMRQLWLLLRNPE